MKGKAIDWRAIRQTVQAEPLIDFNSAEGVEEIDNLTHPFAPADSHARAREGRCAEIRFGDPNQEGARP